MHPTLQQIYGEVQKANTHEVRAYLLGALHDGTFNRTHRTIRIAQADTRWLEVLQKLFLKLGSRSWIYREGSRDVWVIESTCRLERLTEFPTEKEQIAFVRGYFDAEGGVPTRLRDRFYIQFVQKDKKDLSRVTQFLVGLGIRCGVIHNPSARVDPNYWRFYVLGSSREAFIRLMASWHPRKRQLLDARLGQSTLTR